jgi:UDP-2-acetamido-3-amino-2,3-dideoxy-glucuronate N-acetyltransferase
MGADEARIFVHPTSVVDQPCSIGDGTKVWHFCHIMNNCQIGRNCSLGQNVFIASSVIIGNRVKVQNNVSVYAGVIIEDDVFLGPSMVFTNVVNPRSHVPRKNEYVPTLVKKGVSIGANATIVCGVTLGNYAFVGAGAVVTRDVPPYALVYGNPARVNGWMCQCGIRLNFRSSANGDRTTCRACGGSYLKNGNEIRVCEEQA